MNLIKRLRPKEALMDDLTEGQKKWIKRKAWYKKLETEPKVYLNRKDVESLLFVGKTKAMAIIHAAGGVNYDGIWRLDKQDLIDYLISKEFGDVA